MVGWGTGQSFLRSGSRTARHSHDHQVYIRDLDTPFGTYVNDVKIKITKALKTDDIIVSRFFSRVNRSSGSMDSAEPRL
ncbi:FHA domain-containing protein, partial [Alkalibacillus haloalkaliphilus]|uniref:FHA domain-containing protein n=1 Tax=Alkalibacillus haloalkaliphilus TaxID=94136 RepID=UPI0034DE7F5C